MIFLLSGAATAAFITAGILSEKNLLTQINYNDFHSRINGYNY